MAMRANDIKKAIDVWAAHSDHLKKTLNKADSALGDGDTGSMLARVIQAISDADFIPDVDLGGIFMAMAKVTLSTTGSSLGTLIATALMTLSKDSRELFELEDSELAERLKLAKTAMENRGSASVGDKTVIDALEAVIEGLSATNSKESAVVRVKQSVDQALVSFRDQPCKIGRARMYESASMGKDDPGMLAVSLLVDLLYQHQR